MPAALIAFGCALLITASAAAQSNQFKRIRDISVNCTESLSCDLQAYNARAPLYSVAFRRSAAPNAPVTLVFGVRETIASGSTVTFSVDGKKVLEVPVSDLHYRAALYEYNYADTDAINALIDAAAGGDELRVSYRTRGIDTVSTFSLAGFTAGLAYLDQVQARVGRADALAAVRGEPIGDNAIVRDIEAFDDIPFQLRSEFRDNGACGGLTQARFARFAGFEAGTGGDARLIGLPCGEEDAFNQPYAFWERTGSSFRRVPLPIMAEQGPSTTERAYNVAWDQERAELTGNFKSRSAGDCGTFNRWIWTERDGAGVFVLTESREKGSCDGDMAGGPEQWPLVWPAQG